MGLRPAVTEVALVVVLEALTLGSIWVSDRPSTPAEWLWGVLAVAATATVLWRRAHPVLSPMVGYTLLGVLAVADRTESLWVYAVAVVLPYSAGRHAEPRGAVAVLVAGLLFDPLTVLHESWDGWLNFVLNYLFIAVFTTVIPWAAGYALARRQEQAAARAATAVQDERRRIARELHDVVGHALGVIVVQAGAERATLPDGAPESTRETLVTIEGAAREALTEMRRMVTVMREDGDRDPLSPQPGLGQVETLVHGVGQAGLDATLRVEGEPVPLAPGVDLSAYRIVQEALTNTLRHGGRTSSRVTIRYVPGAIELEVVDDGVVVAGEAPSGFGLTGMMERVALYGGSLTTGMRSGGGYQVTVRLPTGEAAP